MANMNFGVNILPKANNTYSLGNSDYKWNIFVNQINGSSIEGLGLPTVNASDNGKILKVASGAWTVAAEQSVPTKVSDLINDSGFLTSYTETDPTVPAWAKASTKPTYTASEVGALPDTTVIPTVPTNVSAFTNDAGYLTSFTETDPTVPAWAKAATKPTYTAAEVGALPDSTIIPTIPTNISTFTNDAGYLTAHQDISGKANTADLATVATSGDYTDLLNKPDLSQYLTTVPTMTGATSSAAGTAGLIPAPAVADREKFFRGDGTWQDGGRPMVILSYGSSTWAQFEEAYNNNVIVYCRASSNSNPATGSQTRMAFMAYVNANPPTNVEFQYYRSVSSHTATQMGDQVFIYKLDKTSGWSVTTREASIKEIKAGTNQKIGVSWNSNVVTLSNTMTAEDMPMSSSDATTAKSEIDTLKTNMAGLATVATSGSYNDLLNKPTIPTNVSSFTNDVGYLTLHQDISGKADKVSSPTSGNFAGLDSNGNLTDSGKDASNFAAPASVASGTLAAGSWSSATPPTQTISVTGVTASNNIIVSIASTATSAQYEAAAAAKLLCTAQGAGEITVTCYGDEPTENVPLSVLILG